MSARYVFKVPFKLEYFNKDEGKTKKYTHNGEFITKEVLNGLVALFNYGDFGMDYPGTVPVSFKMVGDEHYRPFIYLVCRFTEYLTESELKTLKSWIKKQFKGDWKEKLCSNPVASYTYTSNENYPDLEDIGYSWGSWDTLMRDYKNSWFKTTFLIFVNFTCTGKFKRDIEFVKQSDTHFKNYRRS